MRPQRNRRGRADSRRVPDVDRSEERLRQLLDDGHEWEELDYKRVLDLSTRRDEVELAKDIGAMQVDGGDIVIGAGRPRAAHR